MPPAKPLPEWDRVLTAAAHLQELLPDAVLVGGTATAIHADHRRSTDADHVLTDLTSRFDGVLAQLESVAGWKTARVRRPVQILGSLDGIETGVRQLIREVPLETEQVSVRHRTITVPTKAEMLRIKAVLILKRNATRDYIDFVAMHDGLGMKGTLAAMSTFDRLYPQPNGESDAVRPFADRLERVQEAIAPLAGLVGHTEGLYRMCTSTRPDPQAFEPRQGSITGPRTDPKCDQEQGTG